MFLSYVWIIGFSVLYQYTAHFCAVTLSVKRPIKYIIYNVCMYADLNVPWNGTCSMHIVVYALCMWLSLPPPTPNKKKRFLDLRKVSFKNVLYNNNRKPIQPANVWHAVFNILWYCHSLRARLTVLYLFVLVYISLGYFYLDRTNILSNIFLKMLCLYCLTRLVLHLFFKYIYAMNPTPVNMRNCQI